jgi:SAM-dependent methyltransferase
VKCRACESADLILLLDFGNCFLAGKYPKTPSDSIKAVKYTLQLYTCNICGILQIGSLPDKHEIFHDEYVYRTGNIHSLVLHFEKYADYISRFLHEGSSILEFGSNDGTLLSFLNTRKYRVVGFEASLNMAHLSKAKGIETYHGFFGEESMILPDKSFDAITCSNVYAHAHNIRLLTQEVLRLLKDDGKFFIEVHDADALLRNEFDAIYHEHCVYYSSKTLIHHLDKNGFRVVDLVKTPMHGSGLRVVAQKTEKMKKSVIKIKEIVNKQYDDAQNIPYKITELQDFVDDLAKEYAAIDLYGIAGKAQMLVQHIKLDRFLQNAFDDSELRQDKYLVGTDLKITKFAPKNLSKVVIIGAWNYAEDIIEKIRPHYSHIYTLIPEIKKW